MPKRELWQRVAQYVDSEFMTHRIKIGRMLEGREYLQKVIELDPKGEIGSMAEFSLMMLESLERSKKR